jgi:hypothetical protein
MMWQLLRRILGTRGSQDFDAETVALIQQAHEGHPTLGHRGLYKVLHNQGVEVSQRQIKRFLRARGIRIEGKDDTPPPSSSFPPVA